jgi:XTP/dITP diphosphohydrolase
MTRTVILATNNPNKVRELGTLLSAFDIDIRPQAAYDIPAVEETGLSFVENALLKARHAARHTGLPAIADDSGLEVDALCGAPGIHSARYAGPCASDRDNVAKLLTALLDVPAPERTARFICLLVYLRHDRDPTPLICQGTWEGSITFTPRGNYGFGYDPVFFVPTEGRTAAELPPKLKNRLSHRSKALFCLQHELSDPMRTF